MGGSRTLDYDTMLAGYDFIAPWVLSMVRSTRSLFLLQRSMSVLKVEFSDVRDEAGKPVAGGLSDPRLGTTDRNFKCQTCGESMNDCPGHFGHIDLARPVYHIGFIKKVKKILECVCFHCGKLKADTVSSLSMLCQKLLPCLLAHTCLYSIHRLRIQSLPVLSNRLKAIARTLVCEDFKECGKSAPKYRRAKLTPSKMRMTSTTTMSRSWAMVDAVTRSLFFGEKV